MKRFVSYLCVFAILCASIATAYANTTDNEIQTEYTLSFSNIDKLMRENSTSIKAKTASSDASVYEDGFNPITNEWTTGNPEQAEDAKRRLEDLDYEIDQMIAEAEKTFIDTVNALLNYEILVESQKLTQKSFEIAQLQYSNGNISKDDYDKAVLDLEDALLSQQTLKSNIDLLKAQINISIGRSADSPLALDYNINYDLAQANSIDYEKDLSKYIGNNPDVRSLDDLVDGMGDLYDIADSNATESMFNSAKYAYDSTLEMLELGFNASYTGIKNFTNERTLKENALTIAKESLEISENMYKNGSLSKVAYDGARLQYLQAETEYQTLLNTQKATLNTYFTMLGE